MFPIALSLAGLEGHPLHARGVSRRAPGDAPLGREVFATDHPQLQERHVHLPEVHREQGGGRGQGQRVEGSSHFRGIQVRTGGQRHTGVSLLPAGNYISPDPEHRGVHCDTLCIPPSKNIVKSGVDLVRNCQFAWTCEMTKSH